MREDGYYWVKLSQRWIIAQWCIFGNEFHSEGMWVGYGTDDCFEEISDERLDFHGED